MENHNNGSCQSDQTLIKLHKILDGEDTAAVGLGSLRLDENRATSTEFYNYKNSLTAREMESLVAICDTLIPSIDGSEIGHVDGDLAVFYASSASQTGAHNRVAGLISSRLRHPKTWLLRTALWLLSTWVGSFVFCGWKMFSGEFPYCQRFCRLPRRRREEIMLSWAFSYFSLIRMFFKAMKLLIALVFFTQADEKGKNLTWNAIGYTGPNSETKDSTLCDEQNEKKYKKPEQIFGPLYKGIVDLGNPKKVVIQTLKDLGFPVSVRKRDNESKNRLLESTISDPAMIIGCDAVVVGSGSGGGVVAGILAKAGYKVLVLEKGQYFARNKLSLLEGHAMDKMYLSSGLLATADLNTVVLAGATVGGGSTINWSASIRTPEYVLKEWSEKYGIELFESELYREAMDVVCKRMGVQSGILEEGFNNEILRKGCEELGFPVETIPRNSPADHYCGFCCLGCKKGGKKGTSETWLVDLVKSGNGALLPGCKALTVLKELEFGKMTATGVVFQFENTDRTMKKICVVKSKLTIVACGALRTPHLLKQSGLKNPNIGRNLHIHPVTMVWGWFPEEKWPEKGKISYEGGIMTAMSRSNGETIIQTPALHPGMFSVLIPWTSGEDFKNRMVKFSRTAHIFALARDEGSGTIMSPNSINYSLDEGDEKKLKKDVEKILRILTAAGAEEIGTHNSEGKILNVKKANSEEFERFVREESLKELKNFSGQLGSAHQMGSCRMGVRPENSAVKPTGETWEVSGLFVADSSVFPTALGVNPMVTVQAIAYCVGQYIVDVLRRKRGGL